MRHVGSPFTSYRVLFYTGRWVNFEISPDKVPNFDHFVSTLEFSSHNRVKLGCFQISGNRLRSCTFRFWITRKNSYGNFLRIWTYHNSFCNTATLYGKMSYNEVLEDNRSDNLSILKHQELIPKASTETSSAMGVQSPSDKEYWRFLESAGLKYDKSSKILHL